MFNINDMKFTGKEVEDAWELKMLRDHFAMAALTGLLAANNASRFSVHEAYEIADDMLKVRKEKKDD